MPGPLDVAMLGADMLIPSTVQARCGAKYRHGIHVGYAVGLAYYACPGVR